MSRSAYFIVNLVAGQGNSDQDLATIQEILEPEIKLEICQTTKDVDADQLTREALEQGAEMIIASGGDGTISAIAQVLVGTRVHLGVISRGTANAFAAALGIPSDIPGACATILHRGYSCSRCCLLQWQAHDLTGWDWLRG